MKEARPSRDTTDEKDDIQGITSILRLLAADMLHLVVLETKLFGHTLLNIVGLSLLIALLLAGGWLFTGAAIGVALASLQIFSLTSALLMVALINLALAALAFWRLKYITRDLKFRQSRASVSGLINQAKSIVETATQ